MSCTVQVMQGVLEGKVCKSLLGQTYYSFEGIPYARPPVGPLRFRAPQEPESWSGVRDATKPGNKCAQINPYGNLAIDGSEDCLYLNVYTPKLPEKDVDSLPVLFFIHGGRLLFGYGDYYRPDFLIRHDVILVTINYRLNVLGFLCLNTPDVPGNAGAKDTVMALRWVKDNIRHFNGDSSNITAFGESAGAAIASSYLTSPMADGLFNKVIAQSGNMVSDLFMVDADVEEKARYIAKIMGKSPVDLQSLEAFLTEAPVEDLLNATVEAELSRHPTIINAFFLPVVEKEFDGVERFFEDHPRLSIKNNRYKKLPVLMSSCSHEAALFAQTDSDGNFVYEDNLQLFIPRFMDIEPNTPRAEIIASTMRKLYFDDKQLSQDLKTEYLTFLSDVYFGRDVVWLAEMLSKNVDTYVCLFSFDGKLNTRAMKNIGVHGASHGDLIQYMFISKSKIGKYEKEEKMIVDAVTEAWCNFATNGKPTWKNQPEEWLPFRPQTKLCLNVDQEIKLIPYPNIERYQIWFDLINEDKSKL